MNNFSLAGGYNLGKSFTWGFLLIKMTRFSCLAGKCIFQEYENQKSKNFSEQYWDIDLRVNSFNFLERENPNLKGKGGNQH